MIKLATQNRSTQFVVSLPLPRRDEPAGKSPSADSIGTKYSELRSAFNSALTANCSGCANVECCDNGNVADDEKNFVAGGHMVKSPYNLSN